MEISFTDQQAIHRSELENFIAQKDKIRRLWNVDIETAEFLYGMIIRQKPEHILEIGSSNGYSTFWLSLAAEQVNSTFDSIEVDESRFQLAKANLRNRTNVNLINGLAEHIIPQLTYTYGFIFIDAGKVDYINYLKLLIPKLTERATIIADNVISHNTTVIDYLDFMRKSDFFETETLKLGSGLEISTYCPIK
jgi:predicted O-methyltransferase YrrM